MRIPKQGEDVNADINSKPIIASQLLVGEPMRLRIFAFFVARIIFLKLADGD
jgi:hypothetical protein